MGKHFMKNITTNNDNIDQSINFDGTAIIMPRASADSAR